MFLEEEIKTTKAGSTKLGIKKNLTQEEFNKAIISYLESSFQQSGSAPRATISSAVDVTTTAGRNLVKSLNFEPGLADISVEMKSSTIDVTYDIRNLISSIPSVAEIRKITVRVDGTKQVVANTNKTTQTLSVSPSEFPLTVDVEVRADSTEGSYLLRGLKTLAAENLTSTIEFNKELTSARPIENQEELNIKLIEEIGLLKRRLTT